MSRVSFINDLEFIKYIIFSPNLNSINDVYIKPVCGEY